MGAVYYLLAMVCVAASAAPPTPPRLYQQQPHNINTLDYFLENPDLPNYYTHAQQKQANLNSGPNGVPSRLETLEPDSEVELIPGAQQPQQPPQQTPVSPNLPGLLPGQQVFIVHMPLPGYRPGTIGGYQPVYIVAAAPQGNPGFPTNGYRNPFFLDPSVQPGVNQYLGYSRPGYVQAANQGVVLRTVPLPLNRPFEYVYQEPQVIYQPNAARPEAGEANKGPVQFSQLIGLHQQHQQANNPRTVGSESTANTDKKRAGQSNDSSSTESKEAEEPRRNARPLPPHAQTRQS